MHWALAGAGRRGWPPSCAGRPTPARWPRSLARLQRRAASRSRPPAGAAACAAPACPVFGGVVLDLTGLAGIVAVDDDEPRGRRCSPARSAPTSRPSCAPSTASPSATGRSRSTSRPSAAGWPAAAPASTRPATARSRTWSSASRSCSPTARSIRTGGAPAQRRRPRPHAAVRRLEGTLGVITRRLAAGPPAPAGRAAAPRTGSPPSTTASTPAGGSCAGAPRRPCCASTTASSRQRSHGTDGTVARPARARRGRPGAGRRHDGDRRRGVRRRRRGSTTRSSSSWLAAPQRRQRARRRSTAKGFVVDTMEIAAPWAALPDDLSTRPRAALLAVPHARVAIGPPLAQLPRRRLPLLHLRRHARRRTRSRRRTWRCGTPGTRAVLAAGGNLSHHHGVGLNRGRFVAEALGGGARRARRDEGGARPGRHPEPRQARPAVAVREHAVALIDRLDLRALYEGRRDRGGVRRAGRRWSAASSRTGRTSRAGCGSSSCSCCRAGARRGRRGVAAGPRPAAAHGIVTAVGVFVIVQAVGVVLRLSRCDVS